MEKIDAVHTSAQVRLGRLVEMADEGELALVCIPPLGYAPFPYGDLVPLGLLCLALQAFEDLKEAAGRVTALLDRRRQGDLWSYHSGGLVTSIDSALVLLGVDSAASVEALEVFRVPEGGYVPQLWSNGVATDRMPLHDDVRHWCQPDVTVACLVRYLRRRHGLTASVSREMIVQQFDRRSGLYIANPYFVDWLFALAFDSDDRELQRNLAGQILAGMNAEGTFGAYDILLSTAAAILALATLETPRDAYEGAVNYLETWMVSAAPPMPACPFYSTRAQPWNQLPLRELLEAQISDARKQLIHVQGKPYAITFYEDRMGVITTSLAVLALTAVNHMPLRGSAAKQMVVDRRYRAESASSYVRECALPPYVGS